MKDVSLIKTFNMKLFTSLILSMILLLSLFACQNEEDTLTIMVPQGSPTLSVLGLDEERYRIDIVNGPDPLVAAFGAGSHDAIIAPTNLGAKFFQSSDTYRLFAVIGLGNYHLVSTSLIDGSMDQLNGKEITVFGQNQTSDIIVKHLLDTLNIQATLQYVDSVASAVAQFLVDPTRIVLVAEPSLSLVKAQVPELISIDLNQIYQEQHGGLSFPQASLFIKKDVSESLKERLIEDMESSLLFLEQEGTLAAQKGVEWGILNSQEVLEQAIPGTHITFILSTEAKSMIEAYFSIIMTMNPALIGGSIPNDDFYME